MHPNRPLINLLQAGLFFWTASSAYATAESTAYFVEDLHCSGITADIRREDLALVGQTQEQAALLIQTISDVRCDRTLDAFGIKRFMWVRTQDLNNLESNLTKSGLFRNVKVTKRPLALGQHIAIDVKVVEHEPRMYFSVKSTYGFENAARGFGARRTHDFSASFGTGIKGNAPAKYEFSIRGRDSIAPKDLADKTAAEYATVRDSKKYYLLPSDKATLSRKDSYYGAVDFTAASEISGPTNHLFIRVGLGTSSLTGDQAKATGTQFEIGTVNGLGGAAGKYKLSIINVSSSHSNSDQVLLDDDNEAGLTKPQSTNRYYVGGATSYDSLRSNGSVSFYRSLTNDLHYWYAANIDAPVVSSGNIDHGFFIDHSVTYDSGRLEDRSSFIRQSASEIGYRLAYDLPLAGVGLRKLTADLGAAGLSSLAKPDDEINGTKGRQYDASEGLVRLGLRHQTANFNLDLMLTYGPQRRF